MSIDDAALNIGDDALVTITFSEAVTGFTNADVTAENGTLTAFSVGGRRGDLDGDLHAERAESRTRPTSSRWPTRYTDVAGNAGSGAVRGNYAIDTQARRRRRFRSTTRR